ncbi:MAG: 6-phosphofructokinase [Bacteroidetes bacterium]|nr:6-phosphofructokinase [Bacteroidota bacterium]
MSVPMAFDPHSPEVISFLKSVENFSQLNDDDIRVIAGFLKKTKFKAGETVYKEGDAGGEAYLVAAGELAWEKFDRTIKIYSKGSLFGELSLVDDQARNGTVRALTNVELFSFSRQDIETLEQGNPLAYGHFYRELARFGTSLAREEEDFYREMDVLIIQDGGCAPGYNSVTAFISQFLEAMGRKIFVAAEGFRSVVSGRTEDFRALVYSPRLYRQLQRIPGVMFAPPLREARGADFRSERYGDFRLPEVQEQAAKNILRRKVKILIGIGGDGTLKGMKALSKLLPDNILMYFIPVTIDSDVFGTECIGEHTGVEVGAEKIRCYMADARTHHRCYIIEMMGAAGGYHALHSCLGAGAHLAVLPSSRFDMKEVAESLKNRENTVIVVAEGYKQNERKQKGYKGNAAQYFMEELQEAGLNARSRVIAEGFSRDIRGAQPNNMDITLAQRMARKLMQMVIQGENRRMPAVLSGQEYSIGFDEIRTDNSVSTDLANLANRLGVKNMNDYLPY